jgi:glycosyltransferase 2 family protein
MQTADGSRPREARGPTRRRVWQIVNYGIAAACLYWIFHDIRFSDLLRSMVGIDWWWVPLAVVLDLLVYICAAWEWQLLLRPVGRLSLRQALQAVFAGRFANDVLPVHAGYIIRVYLASRWSGNTAAAVIPSLFIERLFDVLWLALGIGLTTLFFPLPKKFARTGEVLSGVILLAVVAVVWTSAHKKKAAGEQKDGNVSRWKTVVRARAFVARMAQGLRAIGRSRLILAALGLSILKLLLQILAFLCLLRAYTFSFSLWVQLAVFLISYIGISMPSTPAGMGVFQFVCAAGLRFLGIPKPMASGFALLAYVVLNAPLSIAGFIAVTRSGLSLHQMRQAVGEWMREGSHWCV